MGPRGDGDPERGRHLIAESFRVSSWPQRISVAQVSVSISQVAVVPADVRLGGLGWPPAENFDSVLSKWCLFARSRIPVKFQIGLDQNWTEMVVKLKVSSDSLRFNDEERISRVRHGGIILRYCSWIRV